MKSIYELKLHEETIVMDQGALVVTALRVPGGWIYNSYDKNHQIMGSVFVPYHEGFAVPNDNYEF